MPQPNTTQVAAPIDTTALGDTYGTHKSWRGIGGWSEVANIMERDAITTERRHQGMSVWVQDIDKAFILKNGVTNADWEEATMSTQDVFGGTSILFSKFGTDVAETHYFDSDPKIGFIYASSDFPANPVIDKTCYMIPVSTTVTDNDPTKTNTGQTFVGPIQIAWNASASLWEERNGLSLDKSVSSIGAAAYLSLTTSSSPNRYPIVSFSNAEFQTGNGAAFYSDVYAPSARIKMLGVLTCISNNVVINELEANATGSSGSFLISASSKIVVRYAHFGSTIPTTGIFVANSTNISLTVSNLDGGVSTRQTISAQGGKIYVEAGRFVGKATVTSPGGLITINTLDTSQVTIDEGTSSYNGRIILLNVNQYSLKNTENKKYSHEKSLFYDPTLITGSTTTNPIPIYTLKQTPSSAASQAVVEATITASSGTVCLAMFDCPNELNRGSIDSGLWFDKSWHYVSVGRTGNNEVVKRIMLSQGTYGITTATTTGTGTTRTVTINTGTVTFSITDANADTTLASYVNFPGYGIYQITAYTSPTVVTIAVPTTFVNVTGVYFRRHQNLFGLTVSKIDNTEPLAYTVNSYTIPAILLDQTYSLGCMVFAKTTSTTSVTISHVFAGTSYYSHFETPLMLARKTRFFATIGTDEYQTYIGKRMNTGASFSMNWGVPPEADYYDNIFVVVIPTTGATGVDIDLTTNYTVDQGALINQYTSSDTTTTYTLIANTPNGIPFKTLTTFAKRSTTGGLNFAFNTVGITLYIIGILVFFR